ncbi:MAG: GspL/Epsl periplasmic domain-containing protein, partial [Pseudomonadota bacterium]
MFEKRSLGISLEAGGGVKAAELISGVRAVSLARTWTVPGQGEDAFESWEHGIAALRESVDLDNAVIGIPDSHIYRKQLSFPFSSRKRIMQILNSELDGEIPLPVDNVVADFIAGYSPGAGLTGTVMACDTNTLSRFLNIFGTSDRLRSVQTSSVGLATLSIRAGITDGLTLYCGPSEALFIELRSSKVAAIRRASLTESDERNADLLLEGIRQHTVNEDEVFLGCGGLADRIVSGLAEESTLHFKSFDQLDAVLRSAGSGSGMENIGIAVGLALGGLGIGETSAFDLRQGQFKQVTPLAGLKGHVMRTSVLLALVAFLGVAGLVVSLNQARGEYQGLKSQLETEFKELFPGSRHQEGQEAGHIKGELDSLKRRMADLSGLDGRGALSILAGLSGTVPEDLSLELDELSYDSSKLRFEGSVSSFDAVDRIKAALESAPMF